MFVQHQPQRHADKHRRENASTAETARSRDDQRRQFDDGKQQIVGNAKYLTECQLLHLVQAFKQRHRPADGA